MSDNVDPDARREVNDAIINAGSDAIGQMVGAATSSVEKRRKLAEERERREAARKAAKEKKDAAVRAQPQPSGSNQYM